MAANNHQTYIYVGLAGEGQYMAEGGLYRYAESTGEWQSMTKGLPPTQVRALLIHPDNPAVLYAGTQCGPYRSDDRGEHWEALEAPHEGRMSGRWPSIPTIQRCSMPATSRAPSTALRTVGHTGTR